MEEFTIVTGSGTRITGTLNGNTFITSQNIEQDTLSDLELIGATLNDSPLSNMHCENFWEASDGVHFVLREKTRTELMREDLEASIAYIAMMTGVEL